MDIYIYIYIWNSIPISKRNQRSYSLTREEESEMKLPCRNVDTDWTSIAAHIEEVHISSLEPNLFGKQTGYNSRGYLVPACH